MKLLLIFNPTACSGRAGRRLPEIRTGLEHFAKLEIRLTGQAGDAREWLGANGLTGFDGVIAAGGDGTLFEVLNGLYRHPRAERPPLGVIPIGTGNAFARDLGLDSNDWQTAISVIAKGQTRAFDAGRVDIDGETFYFLNIIGMGFPVDAMRTAKTLKKLGPAAYTLAVIREIFRLKSYPLSIEIDGEKIEQDTVFVEISNTRYTGSSFLIAPRALPDDGLLDVTLLRKLSRPRLLSLLPTIYRGAHTRFPEVDCFKARKIKVIGPARLELLTDGEVYGESPFTVTCLQQDVEMFSPV